MFCKIVTVLALVSAVYSVEFQIKNNSPDTPVFVQLLGTEYPDPFILQADEETTLTYDEPWNGRIWGRTDCYSVQECAAAGPVATSLAEVTVNSGHTFYDLSLVDGFNIDLSIDPVGGHGDGSDHSCKKVECSYPILNDCPDELKQFSQDGVLIGCKSSEDAVGFFKDKCPQAFCNPFDDETSTYTCDSSKFVVTFL